jgi:hypothetical protein
MAVDFYPYPELTGSAKRAWPATVATIEFYAETFGEYPFLEEKYAITHFPWGGGMEHQTNTYLSDQYTDNRYLLSHELAHQWWGDYITCETMHDIWLNEGFAVYCEALYDEHEWGHAALHELMEFYETFAKWESGSVYIHDISSEDNIFVLRVYYKGAWILHMLRHYVGDSTFFDILRAYYNDPELAYGNANTADLRRVCETVSGRDLSEFFQDWVYGEYYPKYHYFWTTAPGVPGTYDVYLRIKQIQDWQPQVFDMPIDIHLEHASGTVDSLVVFNDSREQDYVLTITADQPPVDLAVDPGRWILGKAFLGLYPVEIVNETIADGQMCFTYEDSIFVVGGEPPYQYSIADGSLPEGLVLDEVTGKITGVPQSAGQFSFTARVEDDAYAADTHLYTIAVEERTCAPGDLDLSGEVDPLDVTLLAKHVYQAAPPPLVINTADVNGDCRVDPLDVIMLVNHVYKGLGPLLDGCVE